MILQQINQLIEKLQRCESKFETYRNSKKLVVPFKALWPDVIHVLHFFRDKGIVKGDHIGITGTNTYEWVIIDLACIAAGIISVPLDPGLQHDMDTIFSSFGLKAMFTNLKGLPYRENIFSFEAVCIYQTGTEFLPAAPVSYERGDILTYKFTSGSTSRPKMIGAMCQSTDAAITFTQELFRHGGSDKVMVFLPLHTYQQRYWIYSAILFDFDLLLVPKEYALYAIQADQPTVIMGVPFFFETLMKNFREEISEELLSPEEQGAAFRDYLGGHIRYLWTGSAPVGDDTLAFYERMGVALYQGYGMNEVCIVSKNYPGNNKTGSVGKLLPGKHIKFDANGQLLIKSDYPVNVCYYQAPEEDNAATFPEDGYVATGDTGHLDDDGYLYIDGRLKELIVLANAIKIHPVPIEKKMEQSLQVRHCIVYGDTHPYLVALIIPESYDIPEAEIGREIRAVNGMLNAHEKICHFIVVEENYLTANSYLSGQSKILRKKILSDYRLKLDKLYSNE